MKQLLNARTQYAPFKETPEFHTKHTPRLTTRVKHQLYHRRCGCTLQEPVISDRQGHPCGTPSVAAACCPECHLRPAASHRDRLQGGRVVHCSLRDQHETGSQKWQLLQICAAYGCKASSDQSGAPNAPEAAHVHRQNVAAGPAHWLQASVVTPKRLLSEQRVQLV